MTSPLPPGTTILQELVLHPMDRDRALGIGSSDARAIANGDWLDLWREKMGQPTGRDFTNNFQVQLGKHTETFHLDWHARTEELAMIIGQEFNRPMHRPGLGLPDYMAASLDGWIVVDDCPIEAKHTHAGTSLREQAEFYMGQLQHQMMVTGCERMRFSIIKGNADPEWGYVSRDESYIAMLKDMEAQFWFHVSEGIAPPSADDEQAELAKLSKEIPINGLKPYDFTGNNEFVSLAVSVCATKEAAATHEADKKAIKKLVPEDASEVSCKQLTIKRTGAGLRFTFHELSA